MVVTKLEQGGRSGRHSDCWNPLHKLTETSHQVTSDTHPLQQEGEGASSPQERLKAVPDQQVWAVRGEPQREPCGCGCDVQL